MAIATILHSTDSMLFVVECHRAITVFIDFLKPEVAPDVRKAVTGKTAQQKEDKQVLLFDSHVTHLFREG